VSTHQQTKTSINKTLLVEFTGQELTTEHHHTTTPLHHHTTTPQFITVIITAHQKHCTIHPAHELSIREGFTTTSTSSRTKPANQGPKWSLS
jgi:hypothetical protein